jgi:hypothetical protein
MLTLPQTISIVMGAFAPIFAQCIFEHAKLLMVGAILATGKRTRIAGVPIRGTLCGGGRCAGRICCATSPP